MTIQVQTVQLGDDEQVRVIWRGELLLNGEWVRFQLIRRSHWSSAYLFWKNLLTTTKGGRRLVLDEATAKQVIAAIIRKIPEVQSNEYQYNATSAEFRYQRKLHRRTMLAGYAFVLTVLAIVFLLALFLL